MTVKPQEDAWKALKSPHARPWLAVAAELPASVLAHAAWSGQPMAAIGLTLASGALTAATWWTAKDSNEARRRHATFTAGAASSYLTVASMTNPLGGTQLSVLALGGATLAASWNVRKTMRTDPDKTKASDGQGGSGETGLLAKSIGKAKLALRGEPKVEPNKVTADFKITAPGELTTEEIGRRINYIATELNVSPTSVRVISDPDSAAYGQIVIVPEDMLKTPKPWPGPSAPGGSITEPIVFGLYEDGAPERIWLPANEDKKNPRNATHFGVFGMNGSAKSSAMIDILIEILTRHDVIVWGMDPAKGEQTFGPLLPYMDWVEITEAGGNDMIDTLPQVITARAGALGRAGFKNWTPAAFKKLGMPYMAVVIEEAGRFFRNGAELEGLVQEARSAGISIFISLQRPSATSMPTDVREQLGGVLCFGVKGSTTADMALPDDVRDRGARPEVWENRQPGKNYCVAPGVDEELYAMPARSFIPPDDDEIPTLLAA
ncbi:conjugal transfer protein TraB, partial [Streptomyces sp. AC536]